jgi:hypothetical protein
MNLGLASRSVLRTRTMLAVLMTPSLSKKLLGGAAHGVHPPNAHAGLSAGIVVYEFSAMREMGLARNLSGNIRLALGTVGKQ